MISNPSRQTCVLDLQTGFMHGSSVKESFKTLRDLQGIFSDEDARLAMNADQVIYKVQYFQPVAEGEEGGLFWGNTTIAPGKVGREYFMTKGHFHAVRNRAEYYATVCGRGALLLMDESGTTRMEEMQPGTLHYIPGKTAHRVANTGNEPLTFQACWPSDAGHDYATIEQNGFSSLLLDKDGQPTLVPRS